MLANFLIGLHGAGIFLADAASSITTEMLSPVGEGMKSAAIAAIPVGIGVMAVTAGIPIAKKVIKQLGR